MWPGSDNWLVLDVVGIFPGYMYANSLLSSIVAVALVAATSSCALADSLNVKTGAWEMTMTTSVTGMPVPSEKLAQMPPQQRAALESVMRTRASQATTHVVKSCVTQEDLDQGRMSESDDDDQCTQTFLTKSASKVVVEKTCPPPDASTSRMTMEATSPESLVNSIDMVRGGADGKVHVEIKGRWLGATCAGIVDSD